MTKLAEPSTSRLTAKLANPWLRRSRVFRLIDEHGFDKVWSAKRDIALSYAKYILRMTGIPGRIAVLSTLSSFAIPRSIIRKRSLSLRQASSMLATSIAVDLSLEIASQSRMHAKQADALMSVILKYRHCKIIRRPLSAYVETKLLATDLTYPGEEDMRPWFNVLEGIVLDNVDVWQFVFDDEKGEDFPNLAALPLGGAGVLITTDSPEDVRSPISLFLHLHEVAHLTMGGNASFRMASRRPLGLLIGSLWILLLHRSEPIRSKVAALSLLFAAFFEFRTSSAYRRKSSIAQSEIYADALALHWLGSLLDDDDQRLLYSHLEDLGPQFLAVSWSEGGVSDVSSDFALAVGAERFESIQAIAMEMVPPFAVTDSLPRRSDRSFGFPDGIEVVGLAVICASLVGSFPEKPSIVHLATALLSGGVGAYRYLHNLSHLALKVLGDPPSPGVPSAD